MTVGVEQERKSTGENKNLTQIKFRSQFPRCYQVLQGEQKKR